MQSQLTDLPGFVVMPAELGQVLSDPGSWNDYAFGLPRPARAPRVRRPGRILRHIVGLAAAVVTAAVTLAGCSGPATAAQRPVWNGRSPHVWVGAMPLCPASVWRAGTEGNDPWALFGRGRADRNGPVFAVTCVPDGRVFVWEALVNGS